MIPVSFDVDRYLMNLKNPTAFQFCLEQRTPSWCAVHVPEEAVSMLAGRSHAWFASESTMLEMTVQIATSSPFSGAQWSC